jgi:hypothetical protein
MSAPRKIFLLITTILTVIVCAPACAQDLSNTFNKWDQFQENFVKRAQEKFGKDDEFNIRMTGVASPIGTLFRLGGSIKIDSTHCTMLDPNKEQAPNLYPTYTLDKSFGINLGLDDGIIGQLSRFGIVLGSTKNMSYRVDDVTLAQLSDNEMDSLLSNVSCASTIPKDGALLVRGYIEGGFKPEVQHG